MENNHARIGISLDASQSNVVKVDNVWCFQANDREKAINRAIDVAERRGDSKSIDLIMSIPIIKQCF